jgi:hypothetical protein
MLATHGAYLSNNHILGLAFYLLIVGVKERFTGRRVGRLAQANHGVFQAVT